MDAHFFGEPAADVVGGLHDRCFDGGGFIFDAVDEAIDDVGAEVGEFGGQINIKLAEYPCKRLVEKPNGAPIDDQCADTCNTTAKCCFDGAPDATE